MKGTTPLARTRDMVLRRLCKVCAEWRDPGTQSLKHIMHFHVSFGLFVWFWNCVGVRFVHFMCVHFLHSEHSMDCWFILHCFVHFVHGYLSILVRSWSSAVFASKQFNLSSVGLCFSSCV